MKKIELYNSNHLTIYDKMAGNTKKGHRAGYVSNRVQSYNSKNDTWVKRCTKTGKILEVKKSDPFKGVKKKNC